MMDSLRLSLFGKFTVQCGGQLVTTVDARKAQELFGYLLLFRQRPHYRERIATLLWNDLPDATAKRYLSKALWQLQNALDLPERGGGCDLFQVDPDWIAIHPEADIWLDVAIFEEAFQNVEELNGRQLNAEQIERLEQAVQLYQADLLEGWYHDWCILERQRLRDQLLQMLDKLVDYFEAHEQYENGLRYGRLVLHFDRARERTHRRLMRLYYLAGDRTGALRQYEQCAVTLYEELQVTPSARTKTLYESICSGQLVLPYSVPESAAAATESTSPALENTLARLHQLRTAVVEVQLRLEREIQSLELLLRQ